MATEAPENIEQYKSLLAHKAKLREEMWKTEVYNLTGVAAFYAWGLTHKSEIFDRRIWFVAPIFWLLSLYRIANLGHDMECCEHQLKQCCEDQLKNKPIPSDSLKPSLGWFCRTAKKHRVTLLLWIVGLIAISPFSLSLYRKRP